MYPDYEREEYHAILYLEPLDRRNKAAIGYDMFTEENRREAMIRARDTGLPAASKKVTLVQEIDETKQPGFLIYVPLYKDDSKPFTIEERRNTLVGYVYSPFRVHDLFNGIFRRRHPINVDFTVYEGIEESEEHILFQSNNTYKDYMPRFTKKVPFEVAGVTWTFVYRSTPAFDLSSQRGTVPYIFYGGLIISLILYFLSRSQYQAERSAEKALYDLNISENALQESNKQISDILKSITDGFIAVDRDWNFVYVNKAALEIFGKTDEDLIGKSLWQELPGLEESRFGKVFKQVSKEGIQKEAEDYYLPFKSWFVARAFPSKIGISIYFHDITERKILEQRKDEFISIASHELKTPLTTIKGYIQILEKEIERLDTKKIKVYLSRTNSYINKLSGLISDLLDVSKIQAGKLEFNLSTFNYGELIRETIESIQPTSPQHKILIEQNIHTKITADRHRLEQVLSNLLTNAIKYSPGAKKIIVKAVQIDNNIITSVQDFGVGIPHIDQQKLFQRFYRAKKTSKQFSGLGIGLYISSEIIKRHHGEIWVESKSKEGSTFYFSIPIASKTKK